MGRASRRVVLMVLLLCTTTALRDRRRRDRARRRRDRRGRDAQRTRLRRRNLCVGMRAGGGLDEAYCAREHEQEGLVVVGRREVGGRRAVAVAGQVPRGSGGTVRDPPGRLAVRNGAAVAGEAYKGKAGTYAPRSCAWRRARPPTACARARARQHGALLAAYAATDSELVFGRRRLLTGRHGPWVVSERRSFELRPSVLDPAHETVSRCVRCGAPGVCRRAPGTPPSSRLPGKIAAAGLPAAARRQRDGATRDGAPRRRSPQDHPLRRRCREEERVYVLPISGDDAVRRVTLRCQTGGHERFVRLSLAPAAVLRAACRLAVAGDTTPRISTCRRLADRLTA